MERASTLEALLEESARRKTPVHRVIATVGGSTFCDFRELQQMAKMAHDEKIEVIITVGPRKSWDPGSKELSNPEGMMQGFRLRGSDNIAYWIADLMRNLEAGFRGFLVYDEGLLMILNRMREKGAIPRETFFKFSVFGGCASAAGAALVASLGADSLNPISDVSLPILSAMRAAIDQPLDIYLIVVDSFGGTYRIYEAPTIARIASPCYLKIEPGKSEGEIYKPWVFESWHREFIREKVKIASILLEIMSRHAPELKCSPKGSVGQAIPKP